MFETFNRVGLDEDEFENWLEKGRDHRIGYHYLLIFWNELDEKYMPEYALNREEALRKYDNASHTELGIGIYDLYSESRIDV